MWFQSSITVNENCTGTKQNMKNAIIVTFLLAISFNIAAGKPNRRLPFINNDFPKALSEAKARKLPLFVEVWAPW